MGEAELSAQEHHHLVRQILRSRMKILDGPKRPRDETGRIHRTLGMRRTLQVANNYANSLLVYGASKKPSRLREIPVARRSRGE